MKPLAPGFGLAMTDSPRPWGSLLWLAPGLLCLVAALPTGLAAILIASDEAYASRPYQLATCGLLFGGLLLTTLALARVVFAFSSRRRGDRPA